MSNSRSPRAVRSMTIGISGIVASTLSILAAAARAGRASVPSGEPAEHGGPGETPLSAQHASWNLARAAQLEHRLHIDLQELGNLLGREHLGLPRAKGVMAD